VKFTRFGLSVAGIEYVWEGVWAIRLRDFNVFFCRLNVFVGWMPIGAERNGGLRKNNFVNVQSRANACNQWVTDEA
jgi:hypothetical protein